MKYEQGRKFLKCDFKIDKLSGKSDSLMNSDQNQGLPMPAMEKPFIEDDVLILPPPKEVTLKKRDIIDVIEGRESRRKFNDGKISINQLSFILWAVQGVRNINGHKMKRTVPSAGARHPFDTYFYADKVDNLKPGLYRYICSNHSIIPISIDEERSAGFANQWSSCALAMFWVAVPYRCEWRYVEFSHKFCALDAGHIAQNGYLAAEALGIGCYSIGAYSQEDVDRLIGVDGVDEFTCYIELFGKYL